MNNIEEPFLTNKEYNKILKQRYKYNKNKNIKQNKKENVKQHEEKQYSEDKPIIYNIYNNYHIYNGTHKWLVKE